MVLRFVVGRSINFDINLKQRGDGIGGFFGASDEEAASLPSGVRRSLTTSSR
jgi:hypothetical protein